jgi:hypothetical protein
MMLFLLFGTSRVEQRLLAPDGMGGDFGGVRITPRACSPCRIMLKLLRIFSVERDRLCIKLFFLEAD